MTRVVSRDILWNPDTVRPERWAEFLAVQDGDWFHEVEGLAVGRAALARDRGAPWRRPSFENEAVRGRQ